MSTSEDKIHSQDWVVLVTSDGKKVLGHATKNATARLGKRKRHISSLIGARWGDLFAIGPNDRLYPVEENSLPDSILESDMSTEKNNQFLQDKPDNQKLKQDAILQLKHSGIQGENLVQAVVSNSATFEDKTPFSQEKYLKRKRAKFDLRIRVLRPTALTLCDTYFERSPEKTMHLRPDALAIILGYAGVRSGCRAMVYENCTGLITAAVAERLHGDGHILNVFVGTSPPGNEAIRMLNLDPARTKPIVNTPTELLHKVHIHEAIDRDPLRYSPKDDSGASASTVEHVPSARRAEAIAKRAKRGDVKQWLREGCDCLIVATRFDVVEVFDKLLKFVAPSGCFVAYCTHLQDAADLQYALQLSKMAVRVELMEVSLVNHQILPGRSHPEMTDSATGGYILSGMRIALDKDLGKPSSDSIARAQKESEDTVASGEKPTDDIASTD
eukprot:GFKZ01012962.1.p1 GENE.GFKZ01012962.1~~GFKZ01012962.1.p1  ORF type:complete len:443 (+),score=60.03 GFKZ01012962.1:200-1528(+)